MANSYTDANGVYRNKLGITDAGELRRVEYDLTAYRSQEILSKADSEPIRRLFERMASCA